MPNKNVHKHKMLYSTAQFMRDQIPLKCAITKDKHHSVKNY